MVADVEADPELVVVGVAAAPGGVKVLVTVVTLPSIVVCISPAAGPVVVLAVVVSCLSRMSGLALTMAPKSTAASKERVKAISKECRSLYEVVQVEKREWFTDNSLNQEKVDSNHSINHRDSSAIPFFPWHETPGNYLPVAISRPEITQTQSTFGLHNFDRIWFSNNYNQPNSISI